MSSLIFLLVIEVLAIMIRKDTDIKGILINNNEHKIIQYADDAIMCVRDESLIDRALEIIDMFSQCSGLELNMKKTKGIWLGSLKDKGYRTYCNILWTG